MAYINGQALRVYNMAAAPATPTAVSLAADINTADIIACAKSASISQSNSVIDVTCQGSGATDAAGARSIIKGQTSWTVSVETLYSTDETGEVNSAALQAAYDGNTPVDILIGGTAEGDIYYYGKAYISSLEKSVTPGELVSFNASFEGTGTLYSGTIAA